MWFKMNMNTWKLICIQLVLLAVFNPTALWPLDCSVSSFIFMSFYQGEYFIWACWCMPGLASFTLMWPNFTSIKYLRNTWMQESLKYIFLISERCGKAHCGCCFPWANSPGFSKKAVWVQARKKHPSMVFGLVPFSRLCPHSSC